VTKKTCSRNFIALHKIHQRRYSVPTEVAEKSIHHRALTGRRGRSKAVRGKKSHKRGGRRRVGARKKRTEEKRVTLIPRTPKRRGKGQTWALTGKGLTAFFKTKSINKNGGRTWNKPREERARKGPEYRLKDVLGRKMRGCTTWRGQPTPKISERLPGEKSSGDESTIRGPTLSPYQNTQQKSNDGSRAEGTDS